MSFRPKRSEVEYCSAPLPPLKPTPKKVAVPIGTATGLKPTILSVYRDKYGVTPGSAVRGWSGDPVSSNGRYPVRAYRALPG